MIQQQQQQTSSSATSSSLTEPTPSLHSNGSSSSPSKPAETKSIARNTALLDESSTMMSHLSTPALEKKLKELKDKSNDLSQVLTQKLASSQSGQNLLHIGTSLSTLPPGLHSLLTQIHPLVSATEQTEQKHVQVLQTLVEHSNRIRKEQRRVHHAHLGADLYADLLAAEDCVTQDRTLRKQTLHDSSDYDALDHAASLERTAFSTLCLIQELKSATDSIAELTRASQLDSSDPLPHIQAPLPHDAEYAQFLLKLAPRIRRLETDIVVSLTQRLESILVHWTKLVEQRQGDREEEGVLQQLGHVMRGLAILGYAKDIEGTFARVAILPLIRSQVSMGRLDQGGSRGECAGLSSLLHEMLQQISTSFGPILRFSETMFDFDGNLEVDLVTAGVWAPVATALMADAGIKMAIFSPGIASILQKNYLSLDRFLSTLAAQLLKSSNGEEESSRTHSRSAEQITAAQLRIYHHPKTAEFSKKWNLPIYYQLRFGEACSRLNKAIEKTCLDGWVAEVFSGSAEQSELMRRDMGFELPLFLELYDTLLWMWSDTVILRPLAHRFIRGAVQLIRRTVAFVEESMSGKIEFGGPAKTTTDLDEEERSSQDQQLSLPPKKFYCWGDNERDVAAVAWELAILETTLRHDYAGSVVKAIHPDGENGISGETMDVVNEILKEATESIVPVLESAWNERIVNLLSKKCTTPLGAVKIIATNYRLTNRPPPTQASTYVASLLKPVKDFDLEFAGRVPNQVGTQWKSTIVSHVSDKYGNAVEDLLATAQKTEAALRNRNARRTNTGGLTDGEKVKLQVYLDYLQYEKAVEDLELDPHRIPGLVKLKELTTDGVDLQNRATNGA